MVPMFSGEFRPIVTVRLKLKFYLFPRETERESKNDDRVHRVRAECFTITLYNVM